MGEDRSDECGWMRRWCYGASEGYLKKRPFAYNPKAKRLSNCEIVAFISQPRRT